MFRFFRSIRQSLINENKTVRYMKYAVGEFLLIVAGILVALQIETWNEGRKLEQERQELIENLKIDFRANLDQLEDHIDLATIIVDATGQLLTSIGMRAIDLSIEEMRSLVKETMTPMRVRSFLVSYKSALTTGSVGLIKNKRLDELFISYEESDLRYQNLESMIREFYYNGVYLKLREMFGSIWIMSSDQSQHNLEDQVLPTPEAHMISDSEYRALMSQKNVYAAFENWYNLRRNQTIVLVEMKESTQQILAALQSLD